MQIVSVPYSAPEPVDNVAPECNDFGDTNYVATELITTTNALTPTPTPTTTSSSSSSNSSLPTKFSSLSAHIDWGINHPDYLQSKDKKARWSDPELQYLSNLITVLNNENTSSRYIDNSII